MYFTFSVNYNNNLLWYYITELIADSQLSYLFHFNQFKRFNRLSYSFVSLLTVTRNSKADYSDVYALQPSSLVIPYIFNCYKCSNVYLRHMSIVNLSN